MIYIDEGALEQYSDSFDDARSTGDIRQRMTESDIVRDTSGKCNVATQFTSNGTNALFLLLLLLLLY